MKLKAALALLGTAAGLCAAQAGDLRSSDQGYFARQALNVMVFSDYYPEGHQTGVTIVQHGTRVPANGDLRLEASPGGLVGLTDHRLEPAAAGDHAQARHCELGRSIEDSADHGAYSSDAAGRFAA